MGPSCEPPVWTGVLGMMVFMMVASYSTSLISVVVFMLNDTKYTPNISYYTPNRTVEGETCIYAAVMQRSKLPVAVISTST